MASSTAYAIAGHALAALVALISLAILYELGRRVDGIYGKGLFAMSESIVVDLARIYAFRQVGYHEALKGFGWTFPVLEECAIFQALITLHEIEESKFKDVDGGASTAQLRQAAKVLLVVMIAWRSLWVLVAGWTFGRRKWRERMRVDQR